MGLQPPRRTRRCAQTRKGTPNDHDSRDVRRNARAAARRPRVSIRLSFRWLDLSMNVGELTAWLGIFPGGHHFVEWVQRGRPIPQLTFFVTGFPSRVRTASQLGHSVFGFSGSPSLFDGVAGVVGDWTPSPAPSARYDPYIPATDGSPVTAASTRAARSRRQKCEENYYLQKATELLGTSQINEAVPAIRSDSRSVLSQGKCRLSILLLRGGRWLPLSAVPRNEIPPPGNEHWRHNDFGLTQIGISKIYRDVDRFPLQVARHPTTLRLVRKQLDPGQGEFEFTLGASPASSSQPFPVLHERWPLG